MRSTLAVFNADVHCGPAPEPSAWIAAWTRDLLSGGHPTHAPDDFTIVEETATGRIVSALNLISQTWSYGGVPVGVGMVELVGTDPEYRRRGLVRRQFDGARPRARAPALPLAAGHPDADVLLPKLPSLVYALS